MNRIPTAADPNLAAPRRRGVVAVARRGDRLLVIRRSALVVAPGAYCFPGGGIEGEENEPDALVREIQEELAIEIFPVRRVWQSVTPWRVELAWWLVRMPPGAEPVPNPSEVETCNWYTPDEMRRLPGLLASNVAFLDALDAGQICLDPADDGAEPTTRPDL